MKRILSVLFMTAFLFSANTATAQDFGLSFSYFLPKNGEFSTPISPFSLRGVGIDLTKFVALETGISLYRMSGMNLKDMPFESEKSLLGPNFTVFVPAELVFQLRGNKFDFDIKGGGFFFYGFDNRFNHGNFDRQVRAYKGWDVANSNVDFKNHPGFGYHAGFEFTLYFNNQFGVSLETNYLVGEAKFPLNGTLTGGEGTITTESFNYADTKVDFTGLEFSIGVMMTGGGGPAKPKQKKRRR